jgi:hypothetical protein
MLPRLSLRTPAPLSTEEPRADAPVRELIDGLGAAPHP